MADFTLFNIPYSGEVTPKGILYYKRKTQKDFFGTMRKINITNLKLIHAQALNGDYVHHMAQVVDFVDLAYFFHAYLINSAHVTIEEIQDAMINAGDMPDFEKDWEDEACYYAVAARLCDAISEELKELQVKKM